MLVLKSRCKTTIMSEEKQELSQVVIEPIKGGPLKVHGIVTLKNFDGTETQTKKVSSYCRCGKSEDMPHCDGTHKSCEFEKE